MVYTYDGLERHGRLGNQLWQIAWQVGQAQLNNGSVFIKPDWRYRDFFSIPDEFFEPKNEPRQDGGGLFYQELHHWEHCQEMIWGYFQPSVSAIQYLENTYPAELLDTRVHKTSIHFRRGDYLQYPTRFPVPSDSYYDKAVSLALEKNPDTLFVVFSDDYNYAKSRFKDIDFIPIEGEVTPLDPRQRGVPGDQWDLFLMTCCQEHIIANSTFSWWGAFLSESRAAWYPSVWFGPDTDARDSRGIDIRQSWVDGIPENWIEVQC